MSRSRKKTKIFGNAGAPSEKQDKRLANRALRRASKITIESSSDFDSLIVPDAKDVYSPWDFAKDGKHYWAEATAKDMRK